MAQRIGAQFQNEERKKYFKVEKSEGKFINNTFVLDYYLTQISKPDTEIDIRKEILNIITYCIKTYNFKDFSMIEINDLAKQDKVILSRAAIWARPTE
jgi:succinyl-CoA synthetase beta subunit